MMMSLRQMDMHIWTDAGREPRLQIQKEVTSNTKAEDKTGERRQGKTNLKENSEREQMGNSRNIWGAFLFNYISLPG